MRIRAGKFRRALRRAGLPTDPLFVVLALILTALVAAAAAYATSDSFAKMSVQSLARQMFYNETGNDLPITVNDGGGKDRFSFSVPYEKVEPNGKVTRQGVFQGDVTFSEQRVEINGMTRETYSAYRDSGERRITTGKDGTFRIEVK